MNDDRQSADESSAIKVMLISRGPNNNIWLIKIVLPLTLNFQQLTLLLCIPLSPNFRANAPSNRHPLGVRLDAKRVKRSEVNDQVGDGPPCFVELVRWRVAVRGSS